MDSILGALIEGYPYTTFQELAEAAARGVCEWAAIVAASVDDLERLYESAAEDPELYGRES